MDILVGYLEDYPEDYLVLLDNFGMWMKDKDHLDVVGDYIEKMDTLEDNFVDHMNYYLVADKIEMMDVVPHKDFLVKEKEDEM